MRILDIDLDFFLDEIAHFRKKNEVRLNKKHYSPWSEAQVVDFLENRLGLDSANRIPGKHFIHHDEVFHYLKEQIEDGMLLPPFSVSHIDAHSDLATSIDGCFLYIMETMLRRPRELRTDVSDAKGLQKLNEGNFLIFMLACGWLSDLTFVKHDKTKEYYNPFFFKNNDTSTNIFQLKTYKKGLLRHYAVGSTNLQEKMGLFKYTRKGRQVKFNETNWRYFKTKKPFDYIFLTQSPNFTPSTSDALIHVIERYMNIQ